MTLLPLSSARLPVAALVAATFLVLGGRPADSGTKPAGELPALSSQLAVEKRMLTRDLEELNRAMVEAARATERVTRLSTDLKEALRSEDVDPFSLSEREDTLTEAEATQNVLEEKFRAVRQRIVERRQRVALLQEEIARRRDESRASGDVLSGTWEVVSYPGPVKGTLELELDGTLVSGSYVFDGGWSGSLRGNLAGDRLRLERWDAELGFSTVYYGRLSVAEKSIKGTWEATDLAAGRPASGTWVARRRDEPNP